MATAADDAGRFVFYFFSRSVEEMSRGSEIAAELRADQEVAMLQSEMAHDSRSVIAAHAGNLWAICATYIEEQTKTIANEAPIANNAGLSSQRIGSDTLIVSTKQLPILRLTLNYIPRHAVSATIYRQFTAMSKPLSGQMNPFYFTVDARLQPCLTDGERHLTPQMVGDEFIETVREFFKEAFRRPAILS